MRRHWFLYHLLQFLLVRLCLEKSFEIDVSLDMFIQGSQKQKIENFFSSLFDRVLLDKSNEPCPAFVRCRYPIEITSQIVHFFLFFQRNRCTRESNGAIFWLKMPKPRCV